MTPQNLQATFPAATGLDAASGGIIDRGFLMEITDRVWKTSGADGKITGRVAVSSTDVQTILLTAIEIASETKPS